jgi:subtilisin family serine protease
VTPRWLVAIGVALVLPACAHIDRTPDAVRLADEMARQILVTARQVSGITLDFAGEPTTTISLGRSGNGPTPSVDRLLDRIAQQYELVRLDGWLISSLGVYCAVFELAPGQDRDEVIRRIGADPQIESVQPMNVYETEAIVYDDPYASMQPSLQDLSLDSAHEQATGRGVTVAVIDSMVDSRHPEMRGRVPVRRDLVPEHRALGRAEVHGTAMAGVIASKANNAEGIVGVAPDARIVSLRACWTVDESTGRAMCSSLSLAESLALALDLGVDIINMSLAGPHDPLLARLIDAAIEAGVVVVAALPETADPDLDFPASYPGVIAAGSIGVDAGFVKHVLRAPGDEVLSTTPNASYAFFSGNSVSAAFISGVSALVLERRPGIGSIELERLLTETSTASSINACRAVVQLLASGRCPDVGRDLGTSLGARQAAR